MADIRIQVYSDYIWPFCYIALERVERLKQDFDVEIEWKPFELHPEIPASGIPASRLFGNSSYYEQAKFHFKKMANEVGLPVGDIKIIASSRLALMLGEYAKEQGKYETYHHAVFQAYWADGKNIGDWDVLQEILADAGMKLSANDMSSLYNKLNHQVNDSLKKTRQLEIYAVPTFIIGKEKIVGAQPYEVIKPIVQQIIEQEPVNQSV